MLFESPNKRCSGSCRLANLDSQLSRVDTLLGFDRLGLKQCWSGVRVG